MPSPFELVASPAPAAHPAACLNCGARLTGPFCAQCGQDAHTHRFTAAHLLHEIPHSVWHVDRGLPYTIKEMLLRPGHTMRRYLAGQRVDLFRPVAFVLLLAGASSFLVLALHLQRVDFEHPPATPAAHETAAVNHLVFKYFAWLSVATLPLYALLSWGLLRRLRYHFAEHLMASALVMGEVLAVQLLFLPFLAWAEGTAWLKTGYLVATAAVPVYLLWAYAQLGRGTYRLVGSLWRGLLIAAVGFVLSSFLITLLGTLLYRFKH